MNNLGSTLQTGPDIRASTSTKNADVAVGTTDFAISTCDAQEFLAYWSSDTPAGIRPECVPQATGSNPWVPPAICATNESTGPYFDHVLAWVFTRRMNCGPPADGGASVVGMSPRPPPPFEAFSCRSITFVDALTGKGSSYTTEGGL